MQNRYGKKDGEPADAIDEPGEIENRLSINPSDEKYADTVGQWEDGKVYVFKEVHARQVSSGEFEVLKAIPEESDEEPPDVEEEEAPAEAGDYHNPAVSGMMKNK